MATSNIQAKLGIDPAPICSPLTNVKSALLSGQYFDFGVMDIFTSFNSRGQTLEYLNFSHGDGEFLRYPGSFIAPWLDDLWCYLETIFEPVGEDSWSEKCCLDLLGRILLRCDQKWNVHVGGAKDARKIWLVTLCCVDVIFPFNLLIAFCSGPIVRVSPYEVHCIDPEFYNTIYASLPSQRDKYEKFTRSPDCNNATGFTVGHAHHRIRREALAPFFSKRNTLALEKNIRACVDNLFENMRKYKEAKKPFNLTIGSLATSMDILTSYCFGEAFGLLDDETTATKWRDTIFHVMKALPIIRNFPLVARAVEVLPGFLSAAIMPDISVLNGWKSVSLL